MYTNLEDTFVDVLVFWTCPQLYQRAGNLTCLSYGECLYRYKLEAKYLNSYL